MSTQFVTSQDGTRIAFESKGQGPAIVLLHGAGKTHQDWTTVGYVDRLIKAFQVITIDLRGTGESEIRTEETDYAIEKLFNDVRAVVDACGVERFILWGYSLGGSLARYFGTMTAQVIALVVVGAPLTQVENSKLNQYTNAFLEKWRPSVKAYKMGQLSDKEADALRKGGVLVWSALFSAMRTWSARTLNEIRCPTLLVVGDKDVEVMEWVKMNQKALEDNQVKVKVIEGVNHEQEFMEIEKVYPTVENYLLSLGQ